MPTPTGATLTLTGGVPRVGATLRAVPAALTLTGGTPRIGVMVRPTAPTLTLVGGAPMMSAVIRPAPATVTLTGATPVVTAIAHQVVHPVGGKLAVTGGILWLDPAWVRMRIEVADTATAGRIWVSKPSATLAEPIPTDHIDGLDDTLGEIDATTAGTLNVLTNKFGGGSSVAATPADVALAIDSMFGVLSRGGSTRSDVAAHVNSTLTTSSDVDGGLIVGAVSDAALPGVRRTTSALVDSARGWYMQQADYTHAEAEEALAGAAGVAVSNAALVKQLESLAGVTSMPYGYVDTFGRTSTDGQLGGSPYWSVTYGSGNGLWISDATNAVWLPIYPGGARTSIARLTDTTWNQSDGDYVATSVVLASAPTESGGLTGWNTVVGRCNSAKTTYVQFAVSGLSTWRLSCVVSGTETVWATGSCPTVPTAGTALTLFTGFVNSPNVSVPRQFRAMIGSIVVCDHTEVGTTSQYGAGYRYYGFGGRAEGALYQVQSSPGNVHQFSAYMNNGRW